MTNQERVANFLQECGVCSGLYQPGRGYTGVRVFSGTGVFENASGTGGQVRYTGYKV